MIPLSALFYIHVKTKFPVSLQSTLRAFQSISKINRVNLEIFVISYFNYKFNNRLDQICGRVGFFNDIAWRQDNRKY